MKTIKLEDTSLIIKLFELLVAQVPDLKEIHNSVLEFHTRKEKAVTEGNYEEAARIREDELNMVREMIKLLNSKGILDNNNLLQISMVVPPIEDPKALIQWLGK